MKHWLAALTILALGCGTTDEPTEPTAAATASVPDVQVSDEGPGEPLSGTLRVLTYNVHGLPAEITGDDTNGRMAQIQPLMAGFDIVGLQEDFTDEGHALLTGGLVQKLVRFVLPKDGHIFGSGLTLLHDPAIDEVLRDQQHFERCNGYTNHASDCLASKGIQMVRLRVAPGVEIDVYNSHFEAGGSSDDEAARASHVDHLVGMISTLSEGRAVIFTGDTNLHPEDEPDATVLSDWLAQTGLKDTCAAVDCPLPLRIDRIFVRSSDSVTLVVQDWALEPGWSSEDGVPLSDHDPISATVHWSR